MGNSLYFFFVFLNVLGLGFLFWCIDGQGVPIKNMFSGSKDEVLSIVILDKLFSTGSWLLSGLISRHSVFLSSILITSFSEYWMLLLTIMLFLIIAQCVHILFDIEYTNILKRKIHVKCFTKDDYSVVALFIDKKIKCFCSFLKDSRVFSLKIKALICRILSFSLKFLILLSEGALQR